jgi:hypothetical protein
MPWSKSGKIQKKGGGLDDGAATPTLTMTAWLIGLCLLELNPLLL